MDREFLVRFNRALEYDALDPTTDEGKRFYVELEDRPEILDISGTIELAGQATVQALTGPNGSGKTTQLLRMNADLRAEGYTTAYVDVLALLSQTAPVGVVDFLVAVALGVIEELHGDETPEAKAPWYQRLWDRMRGISVSIEGATVDLGVVSVDLKAELKANVSFVEQLRRALEPNLAEFVREIRAFVADQFEGSAGRSVLIVDSTEKLGGSDEVIESVRNLFLHHGDKLRFPGVHVVYTVPPYLPTLVPGFMAAFDGTVRQVLTTKLLDRETEEVIPEAIAKLVEVVERREPEWKRLLDREQLEQIILSSGGHLRDLLYLLKELITKAIRVDLPVDDQLVTAAIGAVAFQFGAMLSEDRELLQRILDAKGEYSPAEAEMRKISTLLQTHVLLPHRNSKWWYEVHPLARRFVEPQP